jgi:5'-nucleotidase
MITNDDGYNAPGIAAISSALAKLPNVHVVVVAPAANQSGTGGSTTKGHLKIKRRHTLNGLPAYAVDGYPADTVRAAIDELHLHPDLVVSGINAGQNLGPAVDLSGTIGAARAAVARGIPAVAVSSGLGDPIRFNVAVPFVRRWVTNNTAQVLSGQAKVHVLSINVPSCAKGSVRGIVRVPPDLNPNDLGKATAESHCTSKKPAGNTDVHAFNVGFATKDVVPSTPATKSEMQAAEV